MADLDSHRSEVHVRQLDLSVFERRVAATRWPRPTGTYVAPQKVAASDDQELTH